MTMNCVRLVERRLDLVHHAERRGVDLENGEVERDGDERLLAAREQRERLERLARRLDLDLDAAVEHGVLVLQLKRGLAAAEELEEGLLKALADESELLLEDDRHLARDVLNDAQQLLLGLFHIVALSGEVGIARVHAVEFLDGADVDIAEAVDLALQFIDAAARLRHALQLDALLLCRGVGQLVALPELIQYLLFLHRGGNALLLEPARGGLCLREQLIALAVSAVVRAALALKRQLGLRQLRQLRPALLGVGAQRSGHRVMLRDLLLRGLDLRAVVLDERTASVLVAAHLLGERLEVAQRAFGRLPLGGKARKRALARGDLVAEVRAVALELVLAGELFLALRTAACGLGLFQLLRARGDALELGGDVALPRAERFEQHIVLLLFTRQAEHRVLRAALLLARDVQLILRGVQVALGLVRLAERGIELLR